MWTPTFRPDAQTFRLARAARRKIEGDVQKHRGYKSEPVCARETEKGFDGRQIRACPGASLTEDMSDEEWTEWISKYAEA